MVFAKLTLLLSLALAANAQVTEPPTPTTFVKLAARQATPTGLTTQFPASAGSTALPSAIVVKAGTHFDGRMLKYDRNSEFPFIAFFLIGSSNSYLGKVCQEQKETGEKDAMFILENGATLSNVLIGPNQAEGVHCKGTCTLNNVWWLDVCEGTVILACNSMDPDLRSLL